METRANSLKGGDAKLWIYSRKATIGRLLNVVLNDAFGWLAPRAFFRESGFKLLKWYLIFRHR